ncbi:MAG: RedB protein [Acidobacteriota bacterium]|nr:RedB protein [Acidobacteriota bacterium]
MKRRGIIIGVISMAALIWVGTVAAAVQSIRRFESTPGLAAIAPPAWPVRSALPRAGGAWTLVMLVHPHCSCSRASVKELEAVLEGAPRSVQPYVLVYRPREFAAGWEQTDVYASAKRLRRTRVVIDEDGREAALFGGFTSGQTFLYDGDGQLRFEGGITMLRGHAGLNSGRAGIIRIASTNDGEGSHPVFGCAISAKPSVVAGVREPEGEIK